MTTSRRYGAITTKGLENLIDALEASVLADPDEVILEDTREIPGGADAVRRLVAEQLPAGRFHQPGQKGPRGGETEKLPAPGVPPPWQLPPRGRG